MSTTLTIRDETPTGKPVRTFTIEMMSARVPVRELIRSRVYQEVADYNRTPGETFHGLVQPTDAERTLNGYRMQKPRELDWKAQYEKALEAYARNGFFVLVDDQQVESLEQEVEVTAETRVSFVKLVPLVGG
ncbi:MAG: hypothetical protein IT452_20210 [Planctomycetia bacterium]|nr:hypothetical protein [Planctomycetia bacterium]